ncbi:serine/threonine-protein kinase, partial [Klenkia sp. PcliD-1-E]|uniref:serine/threonine-protein kinase n=1 Tax=Klenkia sp. PcliD-1-E TaxID=2954492 RepID=UPI002096F020
MHELETRVLGDRYELRSVIATGGMGRVWRAHDQRLSRPVAVKLLRGEYAGDPEFIARFRAEARHTALLRDEHVAAVYDYGETGVDGEQLAWLVMELVEGEPLSALRKREGALDADRVVDLLRQAASGLAAAHAAGVVHRDVKPGNLLVRPDGSLAITDFGIAWSAASVSLTGTGEVIGTAHYLSPEQAQGRQATAASDVYALGMVAYELLTGRRAWPGDSPVAVVLQQIHDDPEPLPGTVPAGVRQLVDAMLVKDPADRLADGAAVLAEVERLVERGLGPATVKLAPTRHRRAATPPPRRRRVLLPAAAAVGLAGV